MGIFDKARDALHEHADKVDPVADRLADEAGTRTAGTHRATVDHGADQAEDTRGDRTRRDPAAEPGQPG